MPDDLLKLVSAIRARMHPQAIWLFGSRARGDHRPDSDWDLVVAVPEDAPDDQLDPIVGWSIGRETGVPATIFAARESDLAESWGCPNTLSYELAREGRRVDVQTGRCPRGISSPPASSSPEACVRDARLLLKVESRNGAYLASQAAEHVVMAVATSEGIHIERKDAHRLDTIVRKMPPENPDRDALASISFLEAYATRYRYGTPTGRVLMMPPIDRISKSLHAIEQLIAVLRTHVRIDPNVDGAAANTAPRR